MSHPEERLQVTAIAGSLRRGSVNRALLVAATELAPPSLDIRIVGLNDLPVYDGDVEDQGVPDAVKALREAVESADGLLIATPEYNQGVPGGLKNAVDWLSRPPKPQSFDGRPIGVMGATPGTLGTRAAQYQLRQTLVGLNGAVMAQPMLFISGAGQKFDADLRLTDEPTRAHLTRYLEAFAGWVQRMRK
ncbi:MAG: NADPH-dependent FMN reductase [Acidobacteriota bacterium]